MIEYRLEKITSANAPLFIQVYRANFPKVADEMIHAIRGKAVTMMVTAREDSVLYGVMSIMPPRSDPSIPGFDRDYYEYWHITTLEKYRRKLVARGLLRAAMKFLYDLGAKEIRMQTQPVINNTHKIEEVFWSLLNFDDSRELYKWTYSIDMQETMQDPDKRSVLEEIWEQYNIKQ